MAYIIDTLASPWQIFATWYADAKRCESAYPDAMMLATVREDQMPSLRTVLMKHYDEEGFVFYTNRESRKAQELKLKTQASACFYWKSLQRQIRIEGSVELISDRDSDLYFSRRPRGSQIGAWASLQSKPMENRDVLMQRIQNFEDRFRDRAVPRPSNWGGYRLIPNYFEFWQEQDYRLHDRLTYAKPCKDGPWLVERLYP